jgi:hypothetical protein
MDFKFERFLHVDSSLSAEQQEKVRQMLLKVTRGAEQQLLGGKRREFAEEFFNLIHPDRRQTLAEEISALHSTKTKAVSARKSHCYSVKLFTAVYCSSEDQKKKNSCWLPTTWAAARNIWAKPCGI